MVRDDGRPEYQPRRAAERRPVSCEAILHAAGVPAVVRVEDLSPRGARLSLPKPPPVGARVHVEFPALFGRPTVEATVRHASRRDQHMGVEFADGCETAMKVAEQIVRLFPRAER